MKKTKQIGGLRRQSANYNSTAAWLTLTYWAQVSTTPDALQQEEILLGGSASLIIIHDSFFPPFKEIELFSSTTKERLWTVVSLPRQEKLISLVV